MSKRKVVLFYRKLRSTGNFSIEASFDHMMASFPVDAGFNLRKVVISHFSNGLLPRLQGILEARRSETEINHVTGDVHYLVFGLKGKNTILTIHDCGLMAHPNPVLRRLLKWLWLDLPVRHCRYITAVSEATRQDIIRYTGCMPDKVVVIPTVISNHFKPVAMEFSEECPRILHIGLAPNKNFQRHVEAISGLQCTMHIIGKLERWHEDFLNKCGVRYSHEYNISEEQMQMAYAESDLLLFASTLEGFGMPIVEAQTVGIPVVTSNQSSMPEVAGDGACLVDPHDVGSIRSGVVRVIKDAAYRMDLIENGRKNTSRYSVETISRQYAALYDKINN